MAARILSRPGPDHRPQLDSSLRWNERKMGRVPETQPEPRRTAPTSARPRAARSGRPPGAGARQRTRREGSSDPVIPPGVRRRALWIPAFAGMSGVWGHGRETTHPLIPAKAGIQVPRLPQGERREEERPVAWRRASSRVLDRITGPNWIPAFAGMSGVFGRLGGSRHSAGRHSTGPMDPRFRLRCAALDSRFRGNERSLGWGPSATRGACQDISHQRATARRPVRPPSRSRCASAHSA
ncbi:hypothetical protein ACSSVZ_004683 [Amorphus sp. MBR-141]